MQKTKKIPEFKNEGEEQDFWAERSPLDYVDSSKRVFLDEIVDFTPKYVSIRLSPKMVAELKTIAKEMDVGYQALIKIWLKERLQKEKAA